MGNKLDILVLTDHRGHTAANSLYGILKAMRLHEACGTLMVASRGFAENEPFFKLQNAKNLYAVPVTENFKFNDEAMAFNNPVPIKPHVFDYMLLRLPHPVTDAFLNFLTDNFDENRIINRPSGIQISSSKSYLLKYPQFCPPMKLCTSIQDILEFGSQFPIVLKPLRSYGGKGILKFEQNMLSTGNNTYSIDEFESHLQEEFDNGGYLAMKFLKNVTAGDKRTVVVYGKVIGSALRLPAKDSWLCNVAQGGQSEAAVTDKFEREILRAIVPDLLKLGVVMVGMDTLVDDSGKRVLSEINTLSIGGVAQMDAQSRKPLLEKTADLLIKYMLDTKNEST